MAIVVNDKERKGEKQVFCTIMARFAAAASGAD